MEIKKNIFLKGKSGSSGIVSLENHSTGTTLTLKLYNVDSLGQLALGVNANKTVYKYPITDTYTEVELPVNLQDFSRVSCAVVDLSNISDPHLVMSGSYVESFPILEAFEEERAKLYEYTDEDVEEEIDKNCQDCDNCLYKEEYMKTRVLENDKSETYEPQKESVPEHQSETDAEQTFYEKIKDQLEKMFDMHPRETTLEEILPNSKWTRIESYDDFDYYSLGIIYEANHPKLICYAVPYGSYSTPPDDIKEYAQWLPVDVDIPKGKGYWVAYQDAKTGKTIDVDVIN